MARKELRELRVSMVFLMFVKGQECWGLVSPCSPPALRPGGRRTEGSEGGRREIEKFNIISDTKIWG